MTTRILYFIVLMLLFCHCKKEAKEPIYYQGKILSLGICNNPIVEVLDPLLDKNLYEATWTNELTKQEYKNVVGSSNKCTFPGMLKEGDIFYFTITEPKVPASCVQCLAYSPSPMRKLYISIYQK